MEKRTVSVELLRSLLHYDHELGTFMWLTRSWSMFNDGIIRRDVKAKRFNTRFAGRPATVLHSNGYLNIMVIGQGFIRAHRVAWAMANGVWPEHDVDHINGDRTDNRLCNLRLATRSENLRNKRRFPKNRSGYVGVSFCETRKKWNARIGINGVYKNLGYFETKESAAAARAKAERVYWGDYAISESENGGLRVA